MSDTTVSRAEFETLSKRLDETISNVSSLSASLHELEKNGIKDYNKLSNMITSAVEAGNKEMQSSIKEDTKKTSELLCSIEKRVHKLEDAETVAAAKELEQRKKDRKATIRSIFLVIITFFVTAFLNNFIALLNSEKENEQWKNYQNTNYKLQMRTEIPPQSILEETKLETYFC